MTVSHINNIEVVKVEPALSGLTDRSGQRVVFTRAVKLTLADGQVWHGCTHDDCDFVTAKAAQAVAVWHYPRVHGEGTVPVKGSRKKRDEANGVRDEECLQSIPAEIMAMSLSEILLHLAEQEEWAEVVSRLRVVNTSLRGELDRARKELDRVRTDY